MSLDTLRILRHRNRTDLEEAAGFRAFVPTLSLPTEEFDEAEESDVARKLGWRVPSLAGRRITKFDASNLVEPSRWELLWLNWLADEMGVDSSHIEWAGDLDPTHDISRRLTADGLTPFEGGVPGDVTIRRAETPRGEARAAARAVRAAVTDRVDANESPVDVCDDVLVLVNGQASTLELWRREFERMDLPVCADQARPLSRTAMGAWLLRLARLHDWDKVRKSRALLRDVLLSDFLNYSELGNLRRHHVETALRRLRRHTVSLDEWLELIDDLEFEDERKSKQWDAVRDQVRTLTTELAAAAGGRVDRLYTLFDKSKLLRGGDPKDRAMYPTRQALRRSLFGLSRRIAVGDVDIDPEHGSDVVLELREHLVTAPAPDAPSTPSRGVTLLPHGAYDGRSCRFLIVSGLGEGQFPVAPGHWGPNEEAWAAHIGLIEGAEAEHVASYARGEIERQIRLISHAIESCEDYASHKTCNIQLSYSEQSDDRSVVHPGPLLSLLVGRWREEDWQEHADLVTWADEIPTNIREAKCWDDAQIFAHASDVVEEVCETSEAPQAKVIRGLHHQLAPSRGLLKDRPNFSDAGPYSGQLPGNPKPRETFSASALEAYGQCPAKYYFSRVLKLEDSDDAEDMLDPLETGNMIHAAFFDVAQQETRPNGGELRPWKLTIAEGETEADAVRRISRPVIERLDELTEEIIATTPSLTPAVVREATERWKQAVPRWVLARLNEEQELTREDVRLDPRLYEEVAEAQLLRYRQQVDEDASVARNVLVEVDAFLDANDSFQVGDNGQFEPHSTWNVYRDDLKDVFRAAKEDKSQAMSVVAELREAIEDAVHEKVEKKRKKEFDKWMRNEEKARKRRANDHLLHAELRFGRKMDDRYDPASIEKPLEIEAEGVELKVSGSIDRLDYDPRAGTLAARDYKTSRTDNRARSYINGTYDGTNVQLPLYGLAAEKLIEDGHIGHNEPIEALFGSYEFPAPATTKPMRMDVLTDYQLDGNPLTFREVGETWIASHVENIRDGLFTPVPESCPISDYAGYCDFEQICRSNGDPLERDERYENRRPAVEKIVDNKEKEVKEVPLALPSATVEIEVDAEPDNEGVVDLDSDIFISAGAGTGKTYNLVKRYVAALAAGRWPRDILCITFTRKAAAEMRDRVRSALLNPESDMEALVDEVGDSARKRELLIDLSAAPISTIDSLAGDVVRAERQIRAAQKGQSPRPFDVVAGRTVQAEMELFVSERVLDGLQADEPRLSYLAKHITVGRLPKKLQEAVGRDLRDVLSDLGLDPTRDHIGADEVREKLVKQWLDLMAPVLDAVESNICAWSLDEWDSKFSSALENDDVEKRISTDAEPTLHEARNAVQSIQDDDLSQRVFADKLRVVMSAPTRKSFAEDEPFLGDNEFYQWFKRQKYDHLYEDLEASGALVEAVKTWMSAGSFERDAQIAANITSLAHEWQRAFQDRLDRRGMLRHADVERQAIEALADETLRDELATRFPFRHIFVDESQDTSGSQIELIEGVRDLRDSRPTMFWVGDVKQSIYRFRGAEVDVFADQMEKAKDKRSAARVIQLKTNWRSQPALLRVFNAFFGSILPAEGPEGPLDPGAAMPYEPLGPRPDPEKPFKPALEIIVEAGKGFVTADGEGEDGEDDEHEENTSSAEPLKQAAVRRIAALLENDDDHEEGARVAILVHAWNRAILYRDLLERAGIRADVQGGKGLLLTPECVSLTNWLDARLNRDKDSALAACAQGAGVGISRIGLYCMRRGLGTDEDTPLWKTLRNGSFDADAAIKEWGELPDESVAALQHDEQALDTFQRVLKGFKERVGHDDTADALQYLITELGLRAHWKQTTHGQQRVANISRLLDLVRGIEESHGVAPRKVLREFQTLRDGDDPAAGGLAASGGTEVVITTYYQAKGREWPHIVLPNLGKTKNSTDKGFGAVRVVERDEQGDSRAVNTVEFKYTGEGEPFGLENAPISKLLSIHRDANDRAELKRLLYVAMTRAQKSVICTGKMNAYGSQDSDQHDLSEATNWARIFRAGMGVEIDEEGARLDERSPLKALENDGTVLVEYVDDYLERTEPIERASTDSNQDREALDLNEFTRAWTPITSDTVELSSPSALPKAADAVVAPSRVERHVAEDLGKQSDKWLFGGEESPKGTAVHWLMEQWGFGTGREIDEELLDETCRRVGLSDSHKNYDRQRDTILRLVENLRANQALVDELQRAAEREQLYHELPVSWFDEETGKHLSGSIDLVWRDADGELHLLDYKAGTTYPREGEDVASHDTVKKYYPQVAAYRRGLRRVLDEPLASYGLWFASGGVAVRWEE